MQNHITYYKRNLPHYLPLGYAFFVTFRLANSLPLHIINKLQEQHKNNINRITGIISKSAKLETYNEYQQKYFEEFDSWLDRYEESPKWLADERIITIIKGIIHSLDEKEYDLIAYTIMPNHVHIVFRPIIDRDSSRSPQQNAANNDTNAQGNDMNVVLHNKKTSIVTETLRRIKGSAARECNKILNRSGSFWQHESYDHVVRDSDDLNRIVEYVLNNPIKAGLCSKWEDWKGSYCNFNKM